MANNKKQTRAMLVEDEANARSALVALLEDEGFAVRAAADGAEALLILKAWHPDVILTDIKMPRVDGLELLTLLETQLAAVPVIVMTAYGSIDDAVDAMRRGAADYITKPIALDRLLPAIQRVLTRAAAQAATGDLIGGRYRLEGKLGEGAMGAVYRTTQLELRRPAAIKMLNRGHDLPKARARLLREAKACAALHHPHAVQIYDVGEDDGRPYLVMELLDGEDLWSRMSAREGPLGVCRGALDRPADRLRADRRPPRRPRPPRPQAGEHLPRALHGRRAGADPRLRRRLDRRAERPRAPPHPRGRRDRHPPLHRPGAGSLRRRRPSR
jgi:DNA-binding response OmpR family regulator